MAVSRRMWENQQQRKRQERMRKARLRRNCTLAVLVSVAAIVVVISAVRCSSSDSDVTNNANTANTVNTAVPTMAAANASTAPLDPTATAATDIKLSETYYKDAVFIGNSLADGISLYGVLPECSVYAKIGLSIKDVYSTAANNDTVAIIDQLKSKKYAKVFLAFGESELMSGEVSDFIADYEKLIDTVKSSQSSARIYVMAIPPISQSASSKYGITLNRLKSFNSAIKELASSLSVYYCDCYTALANEGGYLDENVSSDGINLNKSTYLEMLDYISDNSYIPGEDGEDTADTSEDDEDSDESSNKTGSSNSTDDDEDPSGSSSSKKSSSDESDDEDDEDSSSSKSTPRPTVNVLKDSYTSSSSSSSSSGSSSSSKNSR